jgi:glycosyltransferase involved in cell wall biosynthesis
MNPLVSVIIPTYNRGHVVPEAIESVLRQTYLRLEVIVVDDGSTDNTPECLQQFAGRIRVVTQENAGPAAARNRGIEMARGELIAFLDSDDLWLPRKLERQVTLLQKAGKGVPCCLCNICMRWNEREIDSFQIASMKPSLVEGICVNVDEMIATRFLLLNQGVVVRRQTLAKIGGFDESLRLLEDHDLALRLSLEGPWAFIRDPLVIWRESKEGSLYRDARKDELRSREPLVGILERHLLRVERANRPSLRRHVIRELNHIRRELRAAKIAQTKSRWAAVVSPWFRMMEQYRRAFTIRSPWFPKMKVAIAACDLGTGSEI